MKKELQKIYVRKGKDKALSRILTAVEIGVVLLLVAIPFVGAYLKEMIIVFMILPLIVLGAFIIDQTTKIRELSDNLNAVFVAEFSTIDEYGFAAGSEFYYVSNPDILHKDVIGEAHQNRRAPYNTYVIKRGPIEENRELALRLPHTQEFQEKLIHAINYNASECEGWKIYPISRIYKGFMSLVGKGYVIPGERGIKKKIYISNTIEDKKILIQKIDSLMKK